MASTAHLHSGIVPPHILDRLVRHGPDENTRRCARPTQRANQSPRSMARPGAAYDDPALAVHGLH
ncbi:protealysin propeptide domain-containing protein [Salinisphaera sp.]|uniref:protealysin propeptide domain-containing protein n=1 Tax=Salinisphaera sp. TaxID=1914330 RepID=UPI002D7A275A|nr:protealysin propeptide domain-containing protein [Salinisphaera sp.]HET7313410.1 protealysin propeptide domain-containing protein [Salinisphaera sp.]